MHRFLRWLAVGVVIVLALSCLAYTSANFRTDPAEHPRFVFGLGLAVFLFFVAGGLTTVPGPAQRVPGPARRESKAHCPEKVWFEVCAQDAEARFVFPQICSCCGATEISWSRPPPELRVAHGLENEIADRYSYLTGYHLPSDPTVPGLPLCDPCHKRSRVRNAFKLILPSTWLVGTTISVFGVVLGEVGTIVDLIIVAGAIGLGMALFWWVFFARSPCETGTVGFMVHADKEAGWILSFKARLPAFAQGFLRCNEQAWVDEHGIQRAEGAIQAWEDTRSKEALSDEEGAEP